MAVISTLVQFWKKGVEGGGEERGEGWTMDELQCRMRGGEVGGGGGRRG